MTKRCPTCNQEKSLLDFTKNKRRRDGFDWQCRACCHVSYKKRYAATKEEWKKQSQRWRSQNKQRIQEVQWRSEKKRRYGITEDQWHLLLEEQDGQCPICRISLRKYGRGINVGVVDHDHETGSIRGLLCGHCNRALGLLNDSLEQLDRAISYLQKSKATGRFSRWESEKAGLQT